jgi:inorganic pyrophosphatase
MKDYLSLPIGENAPDEVNTVIEIPRGQTNKYEYDPLDVLVLVDAPSFTGCVMTVRPIGFLEMVDQEQGDEKVLAVGTNNPIYKNVRDYGELYPHLLRGIEHFFAIYKELEAKTTRIVGWHDAGRARELISECEARYTKKNPSVL